MQVIQQWSAEGPCQYHHSQANYGTSRGRFCSTPNMSPVHQSRSPQHFDKFDHQRYSYQDRRYQHHHRQEPDQRKYSYASQSPSNNTNVDTTSMMLGALERLQNFTAKVSVQPMEQLVLGSIPDIDGIGKTATIPWLDQVEQVTKRTGDDPVEVNMSKLKGLTLGDISMVRKEEGLMWHMFCQILIENYSKVPYVSDTNLTQPDNKSTSHYLIRAKVLLEHIKHTSKLSQMSGKGLNNLSLIQGLREHHIRRWVTKEQESCNIQFRSLEE